MGEINSNHDQGGKQNVADRAQALDDFWDIESLLPRKQKKTVSGTARAESKQIKAVEIELDAPKAHAPKQETVADMPIKTAGASAQRPYQPSVTPSAPVLTYTPKHPLIREVRVYRWRSSFQYYERFCATAKRMFSLHGEPCDAVPFFSYMPQYDQMNRAQLAWYLYWRDNVRAGKYLATDYSYIFLYLFEIINLPEDIPPREGQRMLCEIWRQYRDTYPLLNRYLADWICDYSLIHQLPPPTDVLSGELRLIAESSAFREFYACPTGDDASHDADIYMLFCSNYDYRKSKVYLGDGARAKLMKQHIPCAFSHVLRVLEQQNIAFSTTKMQKATFSRDSFVGALCSAEMKRRIEVDYCSFTRSHELRFLITDILKYSENKLRAYFGVKSKLSIYGLPDNIKAVINAYFAEAIPSRKMQDQPSEQRPAYEALYDLPRAELSFEHAAEIEQTSWSMTERLVESFGEDLPPNADEHPIQVVQTQPTSPPLDDAPTTKPQRGLLAYRAFLEAALHGDAVAQRSIARDKGVLPDAVVESINTVASDLLGDIVLEESENGGYTVIADYVDDITSLLKNNV